MVVRNQKANLILCRSSEFWDDYIVLKVFYVVGDFVVCGTCDPLVPPDMVVDIVNHDVVAFVDILVSVVLLYKELQVVHVYKELQELAFFHCGSVVNVLGDMYTRV